MNRNYSSSSYEYIAVQSVFLALVRKPVSKMENSKFKPVKLRLKNKPCVISYPCGVIGKYVYLFFDSDFLTIGWYDYKFPATPRCRFLDEIN